MSVEGDLEKIFIYSEENFNPKPIRRELGLEDKPASKNLPLHERNRLATLLWRTGNLTIMEMAKIGAYFAPGSRSIEEGYNIVTLLPVFPLTHSITPFS